MSVRHETKFCWALYNNYEISVIKTENELAEDACLCNFNENPNIITFDSEGTENMANSIAKNAMEEHNNGQLIIEGSWKGYKHNQQ